MAQIHGAALTLLLALTVSWFCQDVNALACCRKYSTRELPFGLIRGYSIQNIRGNCNIDAIIFHTILNKNMCADPAEVWVMEHIRKLRERVKALNKHTKHN